MWFGTQGGDKVSQAALKAAGMLGHTMARKDTLFRPDKEMAEHYEDYNRFRNAHREKWEHTDRFVKHWQEKLFKMAEGEGKRLGMRDDDSIHSWDAWYNRVVMPMKSAFWEAWEAYHDLRGIFVEARGKQLPARLVRVAHLAMQALPESQTGATVMPLIVADAQPKPAPVSPAWPVGFVSSRSEPRAVIGDKAGSISLKGASWSL